MIVINALCSRLHLPFNLYVIFIFSFITGGPHVGDHVGSERAVAAGAHPESVRAGESPITGSGLVPPGRERPRLQDQHPKRYRDHMILAQ